MTSYTETPNKTFAKMTIKRWLALSLITLMLVTVSGCTVVPTPEPEPLKMVDIINGNLSKQVDDMIKNQSSLPNIASFITANISSSSEIDADSAILLYVRYAETESQKMVSDLIYSRPNITDGFYKVFGEEFNYVWDSEKIKLVENTELREILMQFDDAYLTLNYYGEYLGPVVNYEKLASIESLSETVKTFYTNVAALYKESNAATALTTLNYSKVALISANIEDIFKKATHPLLKDISESMLSFSLNLYYMGNEGSSPFDYENKTLADSFIKATKENNKQFAEYEIGKLGSVFLALAEKNNNALTIEYGDLVINYKKFGYDSKKTVNSIRNIVDNEYYEVYPNFENFEDQAIQKIINEDVKKHVEQLKSTVQWGKTKNTNYNVSYIIDLANEKYVSLQLYASSFNSDTTTNLYDNKALTYDLSTGNAVTLRDIFKDDYDNNVQQIKALVIRDLQDNQKLSYKVVKNFDILDNVVFDKNYMIVILKKGVYSDEQQYDVNSYVKYGDLLPHFDMMTYLE